MASGESMRRSGFFVFLLVLVSGCLFAQPRVGTWVSDALLLRTLGFRLTFRPGMTYEIDTTVGKTTGEYTFTEDKIIFKPISVGISAGSAGDTQVYYYTFGDENHLYLHANGVKVKLTRAEEKR